MRTCEKVYKDLGCPEAGARGYHQVEGKLYRWRSLSVDFQGFDPGDSQKITGGLLEQTMRLPGDPRTAKFFEVVELDVPHLRRRVEDALRKTYNFCRVVECAKIVGAL